MKDADKAIIRENIVPLIARGEISLLLGAGFSVVNSVGSEALPDGERLKNKLLDACGKTGGPRTTLKDAYQLARRSLPDFDKFLARCFAVSVVHPWQVKIFQYVWSRIYTTNIDNVLDVAHATAIRDKRAAGEFRFFNYLDEGLISATIGTIPVVNIHGTCRKLDDGFVFSSLEYAKVASRVLDWHNDLAARIVAGGLVVVGNQLDESDIDTYVTRRDELYEKGGLRGNWIVSPNPDEIKADNWRSAGFHVIDATAEEFFSEVYSAINPRSMAEIVLDVVPSAKRLLSNVKAMTWFKSAFKLAFDEIESARKQSGILKHFITGADPEWFYVVNDAQAQTDRGAELTAEIAKLMLANAAGVGILHIIGPSGSGKTTAIRNSLRQIVRSYRFVYEFDDNQTMDKDSLRSIAENFTDKSIFIFYSAADYYFAVKEVADRLKTRAGPYCLFILEDRSSVYKKSKRQLNGVGVSPRYLEFGDLHLQDAKNIAIKIEEAGLKFDNFSDRSLDARASIVLDKEKGYGGDLLSALFSLTTHENFEQKIFQDYESATAGLPRSILNAVATIHSLGYSLPIDYIAGALRVRLDEIIKCISEDLAGVVLVPSGTSVVRCRHRVIATYYYENYIAGKGDSDLLVGMLEYLSRQFTIEDIRFHPLPYRLYRDIVSFEFVYESYFPTATRGSDAERLYHEAQRCFGRDGIFWLHFGRYYRKMNRYAEAVECFRTGLNFYDSFQTRHSLGMTLIERFIHETGDHEHYKEGVQILDAERVRRAGSDPYPVATLLHLLTEVLRKDPTNADALERSKECFNTGLKFFRKDDYFREVAEAYINVTRGA
jgi:hypothetical protein